MLVEPYLDTAALVAALRRDHGLAASAVRFIPVGETAWCYQVTDKQGGRWFLKLGRPDATEPARADFALQLGRALADLGLPVPKPRAAQDGALWSWLRGLRLALFEFVDGGPLSDQDLSAAGLTDLVASLTAAIHVATRALPAPVPFTETFEVWADGLRRCLAELEPSARLDDGLVAEARELVWPQRAALLGMQERVQALGDAARTQPSELVLCHGDLYGDNLLVDGTGRVWLVDWDGLRWHPANGTWRCSPAEGSSGSLPTTSALPATASTSTPTCWRSSCCVATWTTWSTGWKPYSPAIGPSSSGVPTWTGWRGACRAGQPSRPASSTPARCWRTATDASGGLDRCRHLVGLGRRTGGLAESVRNLRR
jgi:Ser/Thr protein kinase RdoA (MazF antagonist)